MPHVAVDDSRTCVSMAMLNADYMFFKNKMFGDALGCNREAASWELTRACRFFASTTRRKPVANKDG